MGIFSLLLQICKLFSTTVLGISWGSRGILKEAQLDENKPQRGAFGLSISFLLSRCFLGVTDPALICLANNTEQKNLFNKIINKDLKQFFW